MNRCPSNASSFKVIGPTQTLKHAGQFILILHIKPHAVVPNEYHQVICIFASPSDPDFGLRGRAREFDRVGNKTNEYEPQHRTISREIGSAPIFQAMLRPAASCRTSDRTSFTSCAKLTDVFWVSVRPILENASRSSIRSPMRLAEWRIIAIYPLLFSSTTEATFFAIARYNQPKWFGSLCDTTKTT